jgi:nitrite reductase/ring-hydroxylating ferredoxin subunit
VAASGKASTGEMGNAVNYIGVHISYRELRPLGEQCVSCGRTNNRKCGRVVCGNCSTSRSTYLASTYVVSPPTQIYLESPHVPHRTCDECMEELAMIRSALRGASRPLRASTSSAGSSSETSGSIHASDRFKAFEETLIQSVALTEDDDIHCPVCGIHFDALDGEPIESHIDRCLQQAEFTGTRERVQSNRMLVYRLQQKESLDLGECPICFEDLKRGDSVGRLECLCVYHERCILGWFSRKGVGNCPVHAIQG